MVGVIWICGRGSGGDIVRCVKRLVGEYMNKKDISIGDGQSAFRLTSS